MGNKKRLIDAKFAQHIANVELFHDEAGIVQWVISHTPTVDAVEVVHGRWIPLEYDGYADGYPVWDLWECSECGEEHKGDEDTLTNYCPNCGAKMDGESE